MEKNQNDKSNQQSDSKPKQEAFEDGTKKKETNPANPIAKQETQQGSHQSNKQEKSSTPTSTQNKSNANLQDSEEEEETDSVPVGKNGSQDTKKANF